jgi:hypothetical protein
LCHPAAAILKEHVVERRTTSMQITFRKPFTLSALSGPQPPGNYTVRMEEEMLDTLSFAGWRRTDCAIVLRSAGITEYVAIDLQELREALVRDGDQGIDPPAAPSMAASRGRRVRDLMRRGGRS